MPDIVTDISINQNWNARKGANNPVTFTFTQSSAAFDITTYTFSVQLRKFGSSANLLNLTEGSGVTNNGAAGTLNVVFTSANLTDLVANDYYWQMTVVHPDTFSYLWFQGTFKLNAETYTGDLTTAVSGTIDVNSTTINTAITLGVNGGGTLTNGNGTTANGTAVDLGGTATSTVNLNFKQNDFGLVATTATTSNLDTNYKTALYQSTVQSYINDYAYTDASESNFAFAFASLYASNSPLQTGWAANYVDGSGNFTGFRVSNSGLSIDVGSDATGDTYYRNSSGYFTRLPVGADGTVLTLAGGLPSWAAPSGGGWALSAITAATGANTINNAANAQEWQWNTLGAGTGLLLSSSSTAAASNTQTVLRVNQTGANATSTQTTYGGYFSNTKTGTSSTNVAAYFDASGGTTNYSIQTGTAPLLINNARMFTVATSNLFLGVTAGNLTMTGVENVGIGTNAGAAITTANRNTYVGYNAGATQISGFNNTFIGNSAGRLTTGSANTFIGKSAGEITAAGASNVAVGSGSLIANVSGGSNVAIGTSAMSANTAGSNTAIGTSALLYNTTGTRITAIGMNTFAGVGVTAPTDSVAIGHNALFSCQGTKNIGLGTETLSINASGTDNVAIGVNAGDFYVSGSLNVLIGSQVCIGDAGTNSQGSDNVIIGFRSGYYNTGSSNISIGSKNNDSVAGIISGSNKIIIGTSLIDVATSISNTLQIQNAIFGTNNSATGTTVSSGNIGLYTVAPSARLHLPAGTATASTAPLKFTTGTNNTTAEAGAMEYNNTFHLTNSDATRRHIVLAPNTTKVTAAAPYTNDGYIVMNIGGTDFNIMTTA
jgi:hypothetical protein